MKAIRDLSVRSTLAMLFLAALLPLSRADDAEPVDLAGHGPGTLSPPLQPAGRIDLEFLSVPPDKLDVLRDLLGSDVIVSDLKDLLKKTGAKEVATATTGLRVNGDGTMVEIADSRLTLVARMAEPGQVLIDGRISQKTFSSTFQCAAHPGSYQLFVAWDQPAHAAGKDPYNAVVARITPLRLDVPLTVMPRPQPGPPGIFAGGGTAGEPIPDPPALLPSDSGKTLYLNRGDNTEKFVLKWGKPNFTVRGKVLVANDPLHITRPDDGGWMELPVALPADFQIDFDVRADANDAMSWAIFCGEDSTNGLMICNRTNTSFGDPSISVSSMPNLFDFDQLFYHHTTITSAASQNFPDQVWTHVTITKTGRTLTDCVGGQTISTELLDGVWPAKARFGLGYYATKNVGGDGQMAYANIRVVQH